MKASVNIITTLSRVKGENGGDQFVGFIDVAKLKKAKADEIEVILVPVGSIPGTLKDLFKKADVGNDDLLMFAAMGSSETSKRKEPLKVDAERPDVQKPPKSPGK